MPVSQRCKLLHEIADKIEERFEDFVEAEIADTGKSYFQARTIDISRAAPNFRTFTGESATTLWDVWQNGQLCNPVREIIGDSDIEAAYQVQEINTQKHLQKGHRLVGRKIGLTAKTVQKQLGVEQPDYGMLFSDMDVPDGDFIDYSKLHQPKVEAEIAFMLNQDMDDDRLTIADMIGAIDYAVVALEIVGSRIADWNIKITDTIADNASSAMFVLGQSPRKLSDIDLRLCGMVMEKQGEPVSVGAGAACMGSPLNAALWLAKTMAKTGYPLRKNDIILSGALGPMCVASAGDIFEARIEGLGSVRTCFE
ncbi:MAG: aldehyde dehydrogenase family protein [Alphaproteobacteria bacterium]|nr:aldehyde dehydrogenase family protein [Alphaproteobacteria bacterium]